MKPKIIIVGAGGHGKVVCDAILAQNNYEIVGFLDGTVAIGTEITKGFKVLETPENVAKLAGVAEYFILAIGNNKIRATFFELSKKSFRPAIIIHSSAVIGLEVNVGEGCVVLGNAVINAFSSIGENTIINSGAVVDHECKIGNHIHLAIGTMVGSNSAIADYHTSAIGARIESFSKII
jgi:sugar O-acyltransferase (sialic acid O-acetyltransferase NeuD family)